MACGCIKIIDADLKPKGRRLVTAFTIGKGMSETTIVSTERHGDKRTKPFHVAATFCPFCGARYSAPASGDQTP